MFWNNTQKTIEEKITDILKSNYQFGMDLNENFLKKNILIVLEIYAYLNCMTDFFLNKNKVDQNIRRQLFNFSWDALTKTKIWSSLNLNQDEINKFIDDRIANYANILNEYKGISAEYFEKIIEYQIQLIMEINKNNKISYYNPLPKNPWEFSPIQTGLFEINELNNLLHDFFIDNIMPYIKAMNINFINEYFTNKNYKLK